MNYRMIFSTVGKVLFVEAVCFVLPFLVSLCYGEFMTMLWFGVCALIALASGFCLSFFLKPKSTTIYSKEGLITVALTWVFMSVIGALPFVMTGAVPSYIDALFETVSGFTTTGASILTEFDPGTGYLAMDKGLLFWRSFTHWIGGMGVLVFVTAISGKSSDRQIYILKAEIPGPTMDKIVPRSRDTAKILYLMYFGMTIVTFILLVCGGMSFFDGIIHALGTAGTGGFGIRVDGCASYSPFCQWVIAIFMFLFGVNFNLYYLILVGKIKDVLKSSELKLYVLLVVLATAAISINILSLYGSFGVALRHSFFQVATISSTTGFSSANFDTWPAFSKAILLFFMFTGACAGSTAGGVKLSRVMLLLKSGNRELKKVLHPRTASVVKADGKKVDESVISATGNYLAIYLACILVIFLAISVDGFNVETNFTASVSCFNNVGPGFGAVGPSGSYAGYSVFSKIVLTLGMLLGRLEIYPLLLVFIPNTWIKR